MPRLNRRHFIKKTTLATFAAAAAGASEAPKPGSARKKLPAPAISCIPILFFEDLIQTKRMSLDDWIKMASRLGLDGIEVYERYLAEWKKEDISSLSGKIGDAGLAVSMFTSYANFASSDSTVRKQQVWHVMWAVNAALAFQTKIVRITAGYRVNGVNPENTLRNVADGLKQCLDYAESRGVALALEDHPEIGTRISDFMRILELVGDERLKVNLDTSNPMVSGDNPVELAKLVTGRVVHVHASDRNPALEHTVAGSGAVDFPGIFKILKANGFAGWISLEAGGSQGEESIRQGLAYIKRVWASA